ncbi:MAG TPA: hypothetical protein VFR78_15580 [Pyrinomonadaceae bacterium]|nr:hypothetical protein [Pyrinomonadaceae bacterium]
MRLGFFKAYGVLTLFLSPGAFAMSDNDFGRMVLFAAVVLLGSGLIFLRKWAALYFSVPLFYYGVLIVLEAIPEIPFPYNLLGMAYGASLMFPLIVTILIWRQLVWRGKWFF